MGSIPVGDSRLSSLSHAHDSDYNIFPKKVFLDDALYVTVTQLRLTLDLDVVVIT